MRLPTALLTLPLLTAGALAATLGGCGASEPEDSTPERASVSNSAEERDVTEETTAPGCNLEGRWRMTRYPGMDDVGPNGERPIGMSREYHFTGDRFRMEGYPPLIVEGRFRVAARDGLTVTLEMTEVVFDGEPRGDDRQQLTFTESCDEMEMASFTYERVVG